MSDTRRARKAATRGGEQSDQRERQRAKRAAADRSGSGLNDNTKEKDNE
jgi:hypothetical protein